ncbi:MAG: hypothetical protein K6G12_05835 [Lachnospiraceae bacterium]|nr:hypothetical protein [Lachnospiraceae bacterium]
MQIDKSGFKKYIIILVATGLVAAVLCAALVVYVDPFFHYHTPLKGFAYEVDNQLSQNPGMAAHMEYDSVILGSSMTVNFDTDWFYEEMGLNTIKLPYSGAYPKDISNIMSVIFETHPDVSRVFLGIDVINYSSDKDQIKFPLPEYLYDDNLINDINYVLNKDVLLNYVIKPVISPDATDLSNVYASWWTDEYYNINYVLPNYLAEYVPNDPVPDELPKDYFEEQICVNMEENIVPFIESHPDTRFTVFYPPYSILFWNDCRNQNKTEATLYEYEVISRILLEYDNVDIFFFADEEEIITDLNNYADYTHYHPRYNHYMTGCFADGTDQVYSMDDVYKHIDHMRDIATDFDYEDLLKQGW